MTQVQKEQAKRLAKKNKTTGSISKAIGVPESDLTDFLLGVGIVLSSLTDGSASIAPSIDDGSSRGDSGGGDYGGGGSDF